ncbi:MAG: NAD(P)H-binding protein [Hyphomicrobiales bacterium]|nr:NAD(P)H-binding protein [Hyphomicrobiales bacterium]
MANHLTTRLTEKYGLSAPIVQAGMAFAGMTPPLCIAVSEAGALGSIAGVGIIPPEGVRQLVGGVQATTSRPFHVNFITCYTTQPHIDLMCEMKPRAVSFHWGHPSADWIEQLHTAGIDVFEQVGSVADAHTAVADGVDVVVAQGTEAGGHNYGTTGTIALTPAIVDAVGDKALVLASGGIADGRGVAAALMLGADGVWIGTRFVAAAESAVACEYKDRLVSSGTDHTIITELFGRHHPEFNPIRVLNNQVVMEWKDRIAEIPADNSGEPVIGQMDLLGQPTPLHKFTNMVPMTGATGDFEEMPLLAGEGLGLIHDLPPAAEIVARLAEEAEAALTRRRATAGRNNMAAILVKAATGRVGSTLMPRLKTAGHRVLGVSSRKEGVQSLKSKGIEPVLADLKNPQSLETNMEGIEGVFLATPDDPQQAGNPHVVKLPA